METKNNFNEVGKFYEDDIAKFWELIHERHMHVGYWDEENMDAPISEASKRLTDLMIEKEPVNQNENFIDIGCGFGLPAIELAKRKKCNIYGITASRYQKSEAEKSSLKENTANLTNFFVYDAKNTPFENEKFDAGWFFESIFHIGHEEALLEARRILKLDAVLLIADFIALPSIKELKEEDKKNLFETFHINSIKTFEEYPLFLKQNGFDLIEILDVTDHTIKMRKDKYMEALNTYEDDIVKIGGSKEFYRKMKDFWVSTNEIGEKYFGYAIVTCRKTNLLKN